MMGKNSIGRKQNTRRRNLRRTNAICVEPLQFASTRGVLLPACQRENIIVNELEPYNEGIINGISNNKH